YVRGDLVEARRLIDAIMPTIAGVPTHVGAALAWSSKVHSRQGDLEAARAEAEQALAIHRRVRDRYRVAGALDALAENAHAAGRPRPRSCTGRPWPRAGPTVVAPARRTPSTVWPALW